MKHKDLFVVWLVLAFSAGILAHDIATNPNQPAPVVTITYPMPSALNPDDFALLCAHAAAAQSYAHGCPGSI